jgi:hypothetical protein
MHERKSYAVFLTDDAAGALGKAFALFIKNQEDHPYIPAKAIDSEGNYFQMTVEQEILAGEKSRWTFKSPTNLSKVASAEKTRMSENWGSPELKRPGRIDQNFLTTGNADTFSAGETSVS